MSFSVYAGEVVGVAGLIGSGRTEIAKIVFGALKRNLINGGRIYLRGKPIRYRVPKQAIDDGIVYITEDRKLNGFFETMRVDDNIYLSSLATTSGFAFLLSRARLAASSRTIGSSASRFRRCSGGRESSSFRAQSAKGGDREIARPESVDRHF